jgi:hypothetical protein
MASKIKVDNIENQCGGAVVTKCGATTTISGSVVKADDIQAADGGNLINQCGTTITLGASGIGKQLKKRQVLQRQLEKDIFVILLVELLQ